MIQKVVKEYTLNHLPLKRTTYKETGTHYKETGTHYKETGTVLLYKLSCAAWLPHSPKLFTAWYLRVLLYPQSCIAILFRHFYFSALKYF